MGVCIAAPTGHELADGELSRATAERHGILRGVYIITPVGGPSLTHQRGHLPTIGFSVRRI
jgi:hypothetical protein